MKYSFLLLYSDPTTISLPSFEWVNADTVEQAIDYFAKKYGLVVEKYDDRTQNVWFNSKDKRSMKYSVRVHEDEF